MSDFSLFEEALDEYNKENEESVEISEDDICKHVNII